MSSEEEEIIGDGTEEEEEEGNTSGLPVEVEIIDRYCELLKDAYVRKSLTCISRSEKGISARKTRHSLQKWLISGLKGKFPEFMPSYLEILAFLDRIWLVGCENLSQEFWWVNRHKVMNLVYVAMVSTGVMVGSKKEDNINNVPRSLMFIYDYISEECNDDTFEDLADEFASICDKYDEFYKVFSKCLK